MVARLNHRRWHYALLLVVGAVMFLWNLGGASLWDLDEGRNSPCAFEMLESGNWVVPTINGALRVDKPVLLYWLQIAAYRCFGVNEFSARLPSALAALAALLLACELGRSLFGKTTGLLGGLIAATTPMLCGAARFANPDALLHLCTLAALLIFWVGQRQPTVLWWVGLGLATGLGMLAKGPVGLVLPAAVAILYLLWEGRVRTLFDRRLGWAALTWCLVALPWYIWVGVETKGAFLRGFFLEHNAGRFGTTMESHSGSPLYYPLVLLVGTAPWSLFAGITFWCAAWSAVRRPNADAVREGSRSARWWHWAADRDQASHPEVAPPPVSAYRFLVTWIAVYVLFFTLAATKLPNYVLPVVVPCALLTARFLERWRLGRLLLPGWVMPTAFVGLCLIGVGLGVGLSVAGGLGEWAVLRGRFIPTLADWAWLGIIPLGGSLGGWLLWRRDQRSGVLTCLTATAVLLLAPLASWVNAALDEVKAVRPLVEMANARQRDVDLRVGAWQLEHLPSLGFYVQRDMTVLKSEKDLASLLRYPLPVYVFLPARVWEKCQDTTRGLGRELARRRDLYKSQEVIVVTNAHRTDAPVDSPAVTGAARLRTHLPRVEGLPADKAPPKV